MGLCAVNNGLVGGKGYSPESRVVEIFARGALVDVCDLIGGGLELFGTLRGWHCCLYYVEISFV